MASTSSVTLETQASQTAVRNTLAQDVKEARDNLMKALDEIAEKHGLEPSYVRSLADARLKKLIKRDPNAYGAFCPQKLEEVHAGREPGSKMTLPVVLQDHSSELSTEFHARSASEKEALPKLYCEAKDEKENVPKLTNSSISEIVEI